MFAISPTDLNWFHFLKRSEVNHKINFWTPTPWNISKMKAGDRLYFMLKSPIRKLGGYGQFLEYKDLTTDQAWNEFGIRNGCPNKKSLLNKIETYKTVRSNKEAKAVDSLIGCIVLSNVVFFDEDQFIDVQDYQVSFSKNIVKIKYFNSVDPFIPNKKSDVISSFELRPDNTQKIKKTGFITQRKGQGVFRAILTEAYNNRCCITGENVPELLEAAHIQKYIDEKSNHVKNGLLLRTDFHKLFDNGLIYIDEDYKIHVSPQVKSRDYQSYNGKKIKLPKKIGAYPSIEALKIKQNEFRNE